MIEGLQETIGGVGESVITFVTEKPIQTATIGVGVLGVTALGAALIIKAKKNKVKRKVKRTRRGRSRDRKFISKQKHEIRRIRKRKPAKIYKKKGKFWSRKPLKRSKKARRGIHYTKKGQPYIILRSGKARFIKKTKRRTR